MFTMKTYNNFLNCILYSYSVLSLGAAVFFPNVYPRLKLEARPRGPAGDPLILTPYLKDQVLLAQNLSRVPITENIGFQSYAGFFTVNENYNSNLYFWYFPPFSRAESAPVVVWLQGGPGGSSLFGLFSELGPLIAKKDGFAVRKYHWALNNHLIFIDNPVGTGFSFTDGDHGYCKDQDCVAKGLYSFMLQFYQLFPYLAPNKFYITGESYAGKYIPSMAMEIHRQNAKGINPKINLQGLAIGNGYCDPINQIDYGTYLYQHGLIDDLQLGMFQQLQDKVVSAIKKENWALADVFMDTLLDGELTNYSYFKNFTGFNYYYNFLMTEANNEDELINFSNLLNNDKVRKSVHVGGLPFNSGKEVQMHLAYDILKSVAPIVSELLSNYRILIYNGQLDIIVAYPLTENFLRKLHFSSSKEYLTAKRAVWKVGTEVAGYVKKAGNLTEVLVRNAGHMVPHDQPKWALDMITKFIRKKLFNSTILN